MMKQLRTIWKTIVVIFMAAFLAACSGNTKQNEASQEAERRAQEAAAEAQRKEERLRDARSAAGNVIYFAYDSSVMTTEGRGADVLRVQTNNSNVGRLRHSGYNLALGERRAMLFVTTWCKLISSGRIE